MGRRWIVLLAVAVVLVHGAAACNGGAELNPQPLPPGAPSDSKNGDDENAGSFGGGAAPSADSSDAGAPSKDAGADGADGADGAGDW